MGRVLIVLVALITMGTAANATTLAAGALYAGTTQSLAVCYLFNSGDSTVSVSGGQIVREGFGPVPLLANTCGALLAGTICYIDANIVNNLHHACKFVISPDGAAVRGTFELRSTGNTVLQSEQLR